MNAVEVVILLIAIGVVIVCAIAAQKPRHAVALPGGGLRWGPFELYEEKDRIRWLDGGALSQTSGMIDEARKTIYVETRFMGIPVSRMSRGLGEFYRVAVTTDQHARDDSSGSTYGRHHDDVGLLIDAVTALGGGRPTSDTQYVRGYTYTLSIVDRHANEYPLFSLSERPQEDVAEKLIGRLRERLELALNVPDRIGLGSPLVRPPKPNDDSAPKPVGPRMMCPNCHQGFPLYLTTCPKCHVALFKDT